MLRIFPRMTWSAIEDISTTAHAQTTAELRLEQEIEAAFEEEAFERVIEIIDSFVASGVHGFISSQSRRLWLTWKTPRR